LSLGAFCTVRTTKLNWHFKFSSVQLRRFLYFLDATKLNCIFSLVYFIFFALYAFWKR